MDYSASSSKESIKVHSKRRSLLIYCFRIVEPVKVTSDDLEVFHSGDYIGFLKAHNAQEWDDLSPEEMEEAEAWGLGMYICTRIY